MKLCRILIIACIAFFPVSAGAAGNFTAWLAHVKNEAREKGIKESVIESAFSGIKAPNARVLELDRKQPEGTITFPKYRKNILSGDRIGKGRFYFKKYHSLLTKIGRQYGVQPQYIVALWGIETNYGGFIGGSDIIDGLTTLAYDGRRSEFFRKELFDALRILNQGHISRNSFKGSWAGAMGQCQFMPSSFHKMAVDYDGDGRKDIWNTREDVFASVANYLSTKGWRGDMRWGREVRLPAGLDRSIVGRDKMLPLRFWKKIGVKNVDGKILPDAPIKAALVIPDGNVKTGFLIYDNYNILMDWNRSVYFASAVGLLADAIAQ